MAGNSFPCGDAFLRFLEASPLSRDLCHSILHVLHAAVRASLSAMHGSMQGSGANRSATAPHRTAPAKYHHARKHPQGDEITSLARYDCAANTKALMILGTSLKVDGPGRLTRQFARRIRARGRVVVYVDYSKPTSAWNGLIDYWVDLNVR